MINMNFSQYTAKKIEDIFGDLKSARKGLSEKEAEKRIKTFGMNEIKAKETGLVDIFWRQFRSPFFYLLFIAAAIALLIGEKIDGIVIVFFVAINVVLGFFQEARAQRAVSILKKYITSTTLVIRDGAESTIEKNLLVPGDIVVLEAGNIVPADLRLMQVENLLIDESILSGESSPVAKNETDLPCEAKEIFGAENMAFAGTSVITGEALGIVVSTGKNTVLGEITKLVSGLSRESVYENNLIKFSNLILKIVVSTIVLIFLANLIIRGTENIFDFSLFCIALIVSIIPEALPVVITFALSEGALKLAKEKVIVKRLSAVEDFGDIEVLCTDKTGTLTENKLELDNVFSVNKEKCYLYGLLMSPYAAQEAKVSLTPFDLAIFNKSSVSVKQSLNEFEQILDMPFDNLRLFSSVLVKDKKGKKLLITKGAPEALMNICSAFEDGLNKEEINEKIKKEGKEGKRVLAIAFKEFSSNYFSKEDEKDLIFLGYFAFKDPLKKTAKEAMGLAKKLGLGIKIITGDSKEVAGAIAKEVGLITDPSKVILGEELSSLSPEDFEKAVHEFSVFARIPPQTKHEIVEALQKKYEVGFMGEGINDAPALKVAQVAIVVREASDVAREVADIVLLEQDLKVVVNGIKEGRSIFSNINKYIKCALASNFGNFYSIAVISLFIPFLPMLPVQILLGNLLSDFPLISIVTDHVDVEELKRPKLYQINQMLPLIISLALVSTIFDFIFFAVFLKSPAPVMQTLWFIESILTEILLIFIIRTRHFFIRTKKPSIPLLALTIIDAIFIVWLPYSVFGQEAFHFVAAPLFSLCTVFFLVFSYFWVSEAVKLIYFHFQGKKFQLGKARF